MMNWLKKDTHRVDPDELIRKADKSIYETAHKQAHVTALATWLERRNNQNGFGEDFEYTLRPKRRKSS